MDKVRKKRRDREIEKLYTDAEKAIKSSLDLKEVLRLICTSVVGLFKVKGASLLIHRKKDQVLEMASHCGLSDEYVGKGDLDSEKSVSAIFESEDAVLLKKPTSTQAFNIQKRPGPKGYPQYFQFP